MKAEHVIEQFINHLQKSKTNDLRVIEKLYHRAMAVVAAFDLYDDTLIFAQVFYTQIEELYFIQKKRINEEKNAG